MATTADSPAPARLGRVGWVILLALLVLAVIAGVWPITGLASTWAPVLLVPPAIGLPYLLPPLRFVPLGETTTVLWIADLAGVAVMLVTAILWARAASRRHPAPSRGRAFGRAVWITTVAVVLGNLVRGIVASFVVHAGLDVYLAQLLGTVLVSALTGALLGVVVGIVAMLFAGRRAAV